MFLIFFLIFFTHFSLESSCATKPRRTKLPHLLRAAGRSQQGEQKWVTALKCPWCLGQFLIRSSGHGVIFFNSLHQASTPWKSLRNLSTTSANQDVWRTRASMTKSCLTAWWSVRLHLLPSHWLNRKDWKDLKGLNGEMKPKNHSSFLNLTFKCERKECCHTDEQAANVFS